MSTDGPGPIRVLHVDDDADLAELVALKLERVDDAVSVETETSATDGLERLADGSIDCVVSDLEMPGMDGLAFLETVREEYGDLPFILFTGKGSEEIASEAISAGVTEYLQKGTTEEQYEVLAHRIEHAVTERRARTALEESERMFSTLVENLPGMVYRCRAVEGWPMEYVSEGCERLTGYDAAAIESGSTSWGGDIIHPADRNAVWGPVEAGIEAEESFTLTYRIVTADGETRWVWERGTPVFEDGDLTALEGFISDVTERRDRREELGEERAVTEHALDALDDAFYVVDHETGELLRWNDRVCEFTGYTDAELAEMTIFDLVPEAAVETVHEAGDRAIEGNVSPLDLEVERKDGERRPLEIRSARIDDEDGEVIGISSIARDVTDRKRRERQLEEFASLVSHDLRNPLHVVQARTTLAVETGDLSHLQDVTAAAERMDGLIDDLLTLTLEAKSVDDTDTEAVTLDRAAHDAWRSVETADATLQVAEPGTLQADPGRLRDALENLFRNAVEHSAATQSLTLEEAIHRVDEGDRDGATPAPQVRVGLTAEGFFVADDGPGIPADEREVVFEYGYTTTDTGTGLGLSIVERVAEAHGWTVSIAESDAGGARVEFST